MTPEYMQDQKLVMFYDVRRSNPYFDNYIRTNYAPLFHEFYYDEDIRSWVIVVITEGGSICKRVPFSFEEVEDKEELCQLIRVLCVLGEGA